jgi:phenylacetate-CoA ligase
MKMFNWRKPLISCLAYLPGTTIIKNLNAIRDFEALSYDKKLDCQQDKIKKLLLYAYEKVPYYSKILPECKVILNGKVCLKNFHHIPVLTKTIIRKEGKNLYSRDCKIRKFYQNSSGGSTGEPISIIQDKTYSEWNIANKIYHKSLAGQNIGDKELRLWGSERDLLATKESFCVSLRNCLYNRKDLNGFNMSLTDMENFTVQWNTFKPSWVESYVSVIYEFGKFINSRNISMYSPKGILVSAGTLYPEMRKKIESVFRCRVFNRYGARETGDMAFSCAVNNNLHLSLYNHYLEFLDDHLNACKHGQLGRVYVTALNNYSMPLVRYDIGDVAIPHGYEICACGRKTFSLKSVEGRTMSLFKTRTGKIIPAEFFIHFIGVVYNEGFISKFQVIQEDYEKIKIKIIVQNKEKFENSKIKIEDAIKKAMGKKCVVIWEQVLDIETAPSGKYFYTICRI